MSKYVYTFGKDITEGKGDMSDRKMSNPTLELPDDTPISDVELPTYMLNSNSIF